MGGSRTMTRPVRCCDHCGRPVRGKPGIVACESIFCSLRCKRNYPIALRRRMIAHYQTMADDAAGWVAKTFEWHAAHPEEAPLDVEALRLVEAGARDIVQALTVWGPVPERALRLIHSAMADT